MNENLQIIIPFFIYIVEMSVLAMILFHCENNLCVINKRSYYLAVTIVTITIITGILCGIFHLLHLGGIVNENKLYSAHFLVTIMVAMPLNALLGLFKRQLSRGEAQ